MKAAKTLRALAPATLFQQSPRTVILTSRAWKDLRLLFAPHQRTTSNLDEKTSPSGFCNQGTASAGRSRKPALSEGRAEATGVEAPAFRDSDLCDELPTHHTRL